ncbi:hypothetical protein [Bifidobacterium canis]|uniref:Uncharacterized protein n=1 Tax=Bifidobacterium canis TaxID=2610880 RepID=A0A7K1J413_9BIFI|nr:hypothetical protein [Bifidobacterium canis]MUH59312.1 hypothetical protein [Bifidobacterium canis]
MKKSNVNWALPLTNIVVLLIIELTLMPLGYWIPQILVVALMLVQVGAMAFQYARERENQHADDADDTHAAHN